MKDTKFALLIFLNLLLIGFSPAQVSETPTGSGTSGDPYQIANINNLYWLTQTTSAWAYGKYIIQTADIDASSTSTWNSNKGFYPIGNSSSYFSANYNGNGHFISNIYINNSFGTTQSCGFFGHISSGTIQNLGITNANITNTSNSYYVGIFAGRQGGSTVVNCYTSGSITCNVSGASVGGFFGGFWSGTASRCFSTANVYANSYGGGFYGDGGNAIIVLNCYTMGNVTRTAGSGSTSMGAFMGKDWGGGSYTNCYTTGRVIYTSSTNPTDKGFAGTVGGTQTFTNNFFDSQTSQQNTATGATAKTTAEMKTSTTFTNVNWDFNNIWNMNASVNSGYPYLRQIFATNTWTGVVSTDWGVTGNWSNNVLPSSSDIIVIPNVTNKPVINNGCTGTARDITIHSGSSLTVNGILEISGNLSNSGTFTSTNGLVGFTGSSAQNTNGISGSLSSLTINNSYGVTLSNSITVTGTLTLTNGLLTLGAYNLTLGSSATISGTPSSTNMIVATSTGELRKTLTGTGSFTFPVGDNTGTTEYSPITLDFTSGTFSSAYAGVTLANSKHPNNSSLSDYLNRYWTVNQSGISNFSCVVTAQYLAADVVGTEGNIYCGKYSGSSWSLLNQADAVNHRIGGTVTGFSSFTGGQQNVMPAELSSFCSSVNGRDVILKWTTSSESNNAGFEIQRTLNSNEEFSKISFITGKGNSSTQVNYIFNDLKLNSGKYKYRLKQIDNNGNYRFYTLNNIVEIGIPTKFNLSQNYPNPFNPVTKIDFQIPKDAKVTMKIYDITGRLVSTLINNELKKADYYTIDFNASNLSSGIYFYNLIADNFIANKKMVLVK